jgi:hypothetical protein
MGSGGFPTGSGGFPTRSGGFQVCSGGFPAGSNALRTFSRREQMIQKMPLSPEALRAGRQEDGRIFVEHSSSRAVKLVSLTFINQGLRTTP